MHQSVPQTPEASVFHTQHGERVHMREVVPHDTALLTDLLVRLSDDTRWLRYFSAGPPSLEWARQEATRMAQQRTLDRAALVATIRCGDVEEAIALAELVRDQRTATVGELAIVVRDDYQDQGIGSALGGQLARIALALGTTTVRADILFENRAAQRLMCRVFGPPTAIRHADVVEMIAHLSHPISNGMGGSAPMPSNILVVDDIFV
jgi:RimJ/RimL family protein N-acetyltransferase